MANKVTFGIKNLHYALFTTGSDGIITYQTPVPVPGSVSVGLDPIGDTVEFYADDMLYYAGSENSGYQGPLEVANVPDQMRQDIFGDTLSDNGLLSENVDAIPRNAALLFEFKGDEKKRRVCLYNCAFQRASIASQTNTNTKNINTRSMQVTASPRPDGLVRVFSTDSTDQDVYDNWYEQVPVPGASAIPRLTGLTIGGAALSPAFDGGTTSYTATASTSSGLVTASAPDGAAVVVTVNGSSIANGGSASWAEGVNNVSVTVTVNSVSNTYNVAVTYSA